MSIVCLGSLDALESELRAPGRWEKAVPQGVVALDKSEILV